MGKIKLSFENKVQLVVEYYRTFYMDKWNPRRDNYTTHELRSALRDPKVKKAAYDIVVGRDRHIEPQGNWLGRPRHEVSESEIANIIVEVVEEPDFDHVYVVGDCKNKTLEEIKEITRYL